jgi:hypothetical protein
MVISKPSKEASHSRQEAFPSLSFTFLHFPSLFSTQPAKDSNPELKKQHKPGRTKISRKTAVKLSISKSNEC